MKLTEEQSKNVSQRGCISIIVVILFIIIMGTRSCVNNHTEKVKNVPIITYSSAPKLQGDTKLFDESIQHFVNNNQEVTSIDPSDNRRVIWNVTITDTWYNSSEVEKIRFCQSVYDVILNSGTACQIFDSNITLIVHFKDSQGILVADSKILGGFNILK